MTTIDKVIFLMDEISIFVAEMIKDGVSHKHVENDESVFDDFFIDEEGTVFVLFKNDNEPVMIPTFVKTA